MKPRDELIEELIKSRKDQWEQEYVRKKNTEIMLAPQFKFMLEEYLRLINAINTIPKQ